MKSLYIGTLGGISAGDINVREKREVFWREVHSRLTALGLTGVEQARIEEAVAKRVPRPGDKRVIQHSSNSDEWYTPPEWVALAQYVMGGVDLDPASCELAQDWIQAATYYTIHDDGLTKPWWGRMWLNPPYSQTRRWIDKAIAEYDAENIIQAVLLVRPATGSTWYASLAARFCRAEPLGRIGFLNSDGIQQQKPVHGNTFFYLGDNPEQFSKVFKAAGCVVSRPV